MENYFTQRGTSLRTKVDIRNAKRNHEENTEEAIKESKNWKPEKT